MKNLVLSLYRHHSLWQRAYSYIRYCTCPFEKILKYLPQEGTVLDFGCGYGIFSNMMALENDCRYVIGIDIDPNKISIAQRTVGNRKNIEFRNCGIDDLDYTNYSAITIIDCLYLMPPKSQREILTKCYVKLKKNGLLVCKIMDTRKSFKKIWEYFQETISVRILGLTTGAGLFYRRPEEYVYWMKKIGFKTETISIDKRYLHPHLLICGKK